MATIFILADDDVAYRVGQALWPHNVIYDDNPSAASQAILRMKPDLVLADHAASATTLLNLWAGLPQHRGQSTPPVVLMMDLIPPAKRLAALQFAKRIGAVDVLMHKVPLNELTVEVNRLLGQQRLAPSRLPVHRIEDEPIVILANEIGGMEELSAIIDRYHLRDFPLEQGRLANRLIYWGGLPPAERRKQAQVYLLALAKESELADGVNAALLDIAEKFLTK